MATVILVRHGRTTANASGVLAGRTAGVRLDETGREPGGPGRRADRRGAAGRGRQQPAGALPADRPGGADAQAPHGDGAAPLEVGRERGITECDYGEWQGRAAQGPGQGEALEHRADPAVGGGVPRRGVAARPCRPARSPPYAATTRRSRPRTARTRSGWRSATATSSSRCWPTRWACTSTCSSACTSTRPRSRSCATPPPGPTCWPATPTRATWPGWRRPKQARPRRSRPATDAAVGGGAGPGPASARP